MDKISILRVALTLFPVVSCGYWVNDLDHPCVRKCKAGREPMTCEYHWTIESYYSMSRACYQCPFNQHDCYRPHCVPMAGYARPVYTANRKLPGPSIQVCKNDVIKVDVHNRLQNEEALTIHWHGFHMRGTQHMDGVPMVTQCPIIAGQDFMYEFTAEQEGTHWWHSHGGSQRSDGFFGSLIVRQPSESDPNRREFDKDEPEHVIILNEWTKVPQITVDIARHHGVSIDSQGGILINGRGTNQILRAPNGTEATVDHHVVYVRSSHRYRFRVIQAAGNVCPMTISIDNHRLRVIAMDGAPVKPVDVDRITCFSGERYDFVLTADQAPTNYWIRVAGELGCATFQELGILRYAGTKPGTKPDTDKTTRTQGTVLNPLDGVRSSESILTGDMDDAEDQKEKLRYVDATYFLELNGVQRNDAKSLHHPIFYPYENAGDDTYSATTINVINNITFTFPKKPLLTHWRHVERASYCNAESLRTNNKDCTREACECTHRIDIQKNQVVELVYVNTLGGLAHPMHLHGYYVDIVGMERMWDFFTIEDFQRLDKEGKIARNLENPPRKDTFAVPPGGYIIVRFKADNQGWWIMHCHFDAHLKLGMGMVFHVEGDVPPPPANMPVCTNV